LAVFALFGVWGLVRSYLSLLAMFGHRAAEYSPDQAWRLLLRNWTDPLVITPGLPYLPYAVLLIGPIIGFCWGFWCWAIVRPRRAG
jgi:hypothetical protein